MSNFKFCPGTVEGEDLITTNSMKRGEILDKNGILDIAYTVNEVLNDRAKNTPEQKDLDYNWDLLKLYFNEKVIKNNKKDIISSGNMDFIEDTDGLIESKDNIDNANIVKIGNDVIQKPKTMEGFVEILLKYDSVIKDKLAENNNFKLNFTSDKKEISEINKNESDYNYKIHLIKNIFSKNNNHLTKFMENINTFIPYINKASSEKLTKVINIISKCNYDLYSSEKDYHILSTIEYLIDSKIDETDLIIFLDKVAEKKYNKALIKSNKIDLVAMLNGTKQKGWFKKRPYNPEEIAEWM